LFAEFPSVFGKLPPVNDKTLKHTRASNVAVVLAPGIRHVKSILDPALIGSYLQYRRFSVSQENRWAG
jgi:hypothetical protein